VTQSRFRRAAFHISHIIDIWNTIVDDLSTGCASLLRERDSRGWSLAILLAIGVLKGHHHPTAKYRRPRSPTRSVLVRLASRPFDPRDWRGSCWRAEGQVDVCRMAGDSRSLAWGGGGGGGWGGGGEGVLFGFVLFGFFLVVFVVVVCGFLVCGGGGGWLFVVCWWCGGALSAPAHLRVRWSTAPIIPLKSFSSNCRLSARVTLPALLLKRISVRVSGCQACTLLIIERVSVHLRGTAIASASSRLRR